MTRLAINPVFAGAVFTEEQMQTLLVILLVLLAVAVVAIIVFLRSAYRLITRPEKSQFDIAVVAIGSLLVLWQAVGWASGSAKDAVRDARRPGQEETALRFISDVTGRTESELSEAKWQDFQACSFVKFDIVRAERNWQSPEIVETNNQLVEHDAALFETAGWTLTRYAGDEPGATEGLAFRAELGDDALILYEWGGLGYSYLDSSCPDSAGNLESGRLQVDNFPE